jgi:hypothetical protein
MNAFRCTVVSILLVVAAQIAAAVAADASTRSPQAQRERYADAVQLFRQQRYAAAYGRIAALADSGHLPSAQLALLMHDQGQRLFGSEWSASPDQRRRWNTLVVNAARQRVELPDNDGGD